MVNATVINFEAMALNVEDGSVPDWVQLLPAGRSVRGVDGRSWTMEDANALIDSFLARNNDLPVDLEHATQIKGAQGEPAPAVGWIKELEARDTGLWGRVEWNGEGEALLRRRAYRYLSPVFKFAKRTGEITRMVSAGLTNNPNLDLVALNSADDLTEETTMDPAVLEALGLNSTATSADTVLAIQKLKAAETTALNRAASPDPNKFVPKADYDLAMNRISDFEAVEKEREGEAINAAIDAAIEAGKVAPMSRDYHTAACREEGGLERFQAMVDVSAVIADKSGLDQKDPTKKTATLSADEEAVCQQMGITAEEFLAAKKEA
ncbi:MAG: phage protease [Rhodobacteraceae bacterium]|nr:phage protease [Paracoccaceae bacterium]